MYSGCCLDVYWTVIWISACNFCMQASILKRRRKMKDNQNKIQSITRFGVLKLCLKDLYKYIWLRICLEHVDLRKIWRYILRRMVWDCVLYWLRQWTFRVKFATKNFSWRSGIFISGYFIITRWLIVMMLIFFRQEWRKWNIFACFGFFETQSVIKTQRRYRTL